MLKDKRHRRSEKEGKRWEKRSEKQAKLRSYRILWMKVRRLVRICQGHVVVTNNPAILVAEDITGLFIAHTISTTVNLETLQCVGLILGTRGTDQPLSGNLLIIVQGVKKSLKCLFSAINFPEWKGQTSHWTDLVT